MSTEATGPADQHEATQQHPEDACAPANATPWDHWIDEPEPDMTDVQGPSWEYIYDGDEAEA